VLTLLLRGWLWRLWVLLRLGLRLLLLLLLSQEPGLGFQASGFRCLPDQILVASEQLHQDCVAVGLVEIGRR